LKIPLFKKTHTKKKKVYSGGFQRAGELILVFCFVLVALCFWGLGKGMGWALGRSTHGRWDAWKIARSEYWRKVEYWAIIGNCFGRIRVLGTLENRMEIRFISFRVLDT
jgi:hypothetical protein